MVSALDSHTKRSRSSCFGGMSMDTRRPLRTVHSGLRLAHCHLEDKAGIDRLSLDELAGTATRAKMEWRVLHGVTLEQ